MLFRRQWSDSNRNIHCVIALHDRIKARPRIAAYLSSPRRLAFNQQGIFRHYPEMEEE